MKNEILFMISSLINKFSICGKKLWFVQFKCEVEQRYYPSGSNPLIPSIIKTGDICHRKTIMNRKQILADNLVLPRQPLVNSAVNWSQPCDIWEP